MARKKLELFGRAFSLALIATPALADPISATLAVIGSFLIEGAIAAVISFATQLVIKELFGPKKKSGVDQRQASILELTLGEAPCEWIMGPAVTGGSLMDMFNYGTDYEFEVQVICIAEHPVQEIEGFYINDKFYAWEEGFFEDIKASKGNSVLYAKSFFGVAGTPPPTVLTSNAPDRWKVEDCAADRMVLVFAYERDDDVWASGRPEFKIKVKGAPLYNPKKDSTVTGGSGAHRWSNKATWEYSTNAKVGEYNFRRGLWSANGELLVGPGFGEEEAPPEDAIFDIGICAEQVALKAGGTEDRYQIGAVIRSDEEHLSIIEKFAVAMAGDVVDRNGCIFAEPGYEKTPVAEFFDYDLINKTELQFSAKLSRDELVNSVVGRFPDPSQLWDISTTPVRRSLVDITADGETKEATLDLDFVPYPIQAQRITEIYRRKSRLQKRAGVNLWHAFLATEGGDWVEWTSDRRFAGQTVAFQVLVATLDESCNSQLTLREIASDVYAWTAASDELDDSKPAYLKPGAPVPPTIYNFVANMVELTSNDATRPVTMRLAWNGAKAGADARITGVRVEYRETGSSYAQEYLIGNQAAGGAVLPRGLFLDGVDYEARMTPTTRGGAIATSTAWRDVEPLNLRPKTPPAPLSFKAYQNENGVWFKATSPVWAVPIFLEVRANALWEIGREVYSGSQFTSPTLRFPPPVDGSNRYWARTFVYARDGTTRVYSATGLLFDLDQATLPSRNIKLDFDFSTDDWPGVALNFTRTGSSGSQVLSMEAPAGVRPSNADYYQIVDLGASVSANWFWLELRAGRDPAPSVPYLDLADFGYLDLASWYPYAVADPVSAVQTKTFIATDQQPADFIDGVSLNSTSETVGGTPAAIFDGLTYADLRTSKGGAVEDGDHAAWPLAIPATFRLAFEVKPDAWTADAIPFKAINTATGDMIRVRYDDGAGLLSFEDSDGGAVTVAAPIWNDAKIYIIAISQDGTTRRIDWTTDNEASVTASATVAAMGAFDQVHLAGAAAIAYEELQRFAYVDLAGLTYAELAGTGFNAEGVIGALEAFSDPMTDVLAAELINRGPAGFSDYRPFDPADYLTRRASIWIRLEVDPGYGEPVRLDAASGRADMPDIFDGGNATLAPGGTRINYVQTFNEVKWITAIQTAGASVATIRISGRDLLGFTATGYNSAGVGVACDISWASQGW